jgi:xanthine dehydrogenase accessory factor
MRIFHDVIIAIRGAGEEGSAIAHRLHRSHFRICMTELEYPLAVYRGGSFSDAVYNNSKNVEGVTVEQSKPKLEDIYKIWRRDNIPLVVDPEFTIKPLIKPDIVINAMMLGRKIDTPLSDDRIIIGVGPGFIAGDNAHLVIESNGSNNLGKVIIDGPVESESNIIYDLKKERFLFAPEAGIFTSNLSIGQEVNTGDSIGFINDVPVSAPICGLLCGLLHDKTGVLENTVLAEIAPADDNIDFSKIRSHSRAIAGGVLEAIMMSINIPE